MLWFLIIQPFINLCDSLENVSTLVSTTKVSGNKRKSTTDSGSKDRG